MYIQTRVNTYVRAYVSKYVHTHKPKSRQHITQQSARHQSRSTWLDVIGFHLCVIRDWQQEAETRTSNAYNKPLISDQDAWFALSDLGSVGAGYRSSCQLRHGYSNAVPIIPKASHPRQGLYVYSYTIWGGGIIGGGIGMYIFGFSDARCVLFDFSTFLLFYFSGLLAALCVLFRHPYTNLILPYTHHTFANTTHQHYQTSPMQ